MTDKYADYDSAKERDMDIEVTSYEMYEEAKATVAAHLSGNLPDEMTAAYDLLAAEFDAAMSIIDSYENNRDR